jgi:predicted Ser/Thr protein kinase
MESSATKRFGRYEVLGELGRGAMGVVYKARDPQIDRLVAVKTVSLRGQDAEAEQEFRMRFRNEAQAAGRLHHPGIVSVFDVGEDPDSGDPYIVLEYVSGEPLNRILARERKLQLPRALKLAEEVARALDYAHEQGVTHRDVKPGNIMVTEDDHAKIADFGIAKLNLAHFTIPGKLLGTPAYMAPEQLAGEGADGRSDLFSLGVILYAMVTGHSPFQGDSATTVCFKVVHREPLPASALDLDLPRDLDAVISRAMAKDPKQRYQSGAELAEDLLVLQAQRASGTTTSLSALTTSRAARSTAFLKDRPSVGPAYAAKLLRGALFERRGKDLILGLAAVIVLVVLGVQSKLLVASRQAASASVDPAPAAPISHAPTTDPVGLSETKPATSAVSVLKASNGALASDPAVARKMAAKSTTTARAHRAEERAAPLSTLELAVQHQFKEATLSVWIDGKLALTRALHGGTQKRLVMFSNVHGAQSETLQVPAGKHEFRFRAATEDHTVDLSRTISADLVGGDDKTLQISFDKHNTTMRLEWQ